MWIYRQRRDIKTFTNAAEQIHSFSDKACMSKSVSIPPLDTAEPYGAGLWFGPEVKASEEQNHEVECHEVELTVAVELGTRVGGACPA